MNDKTIVAPVTAPGRGGVSIIRVSGRDSKKIAEVMCGDLSEPWRFKKTKIISLDGEVLDSGMVVFFESPHSYTGDDVVEFHCHGNPVVVNLIVEEIVRLGAVVAEPGEFTKTAFLNDKIDLAQAESVADLISAQSKSAVVAANSSLSGDFSKQINLLLDGIVKARVLVEASIDFPEDELDEGLLSEIQEHLKKQSESIGSILENVKEGVKLRDGYSVAIVGPPNAGKSTLLNVLAKENIAITSEVPGTTRDLVRALVDVGGVLIEFVDTAGVRPDPENTIEREGINKSHEVIRKSNLSLLVQDVTDQKDFEIELGSFISVMNKSDLMPEETPSRDDLIYLSCSTGSGINELLKAVQLKLGIDEGAETAFLSRKRHEICLKDSRVLIEDSIISLREGGALELVAESLRSAHHVLGEILRPMSADDLLGEIFSEFCIGK